MCKLWLGLDIYKGGNCRICDNTMSPGAKHGLACKSGGDLIKRHNRIRDFIYNLSREAGLNPSLEKGNLLGEQPGRRPADVFIENFREGASAALDVAVTCPFRGTFKNDIHAVEKYSKDIKIHKYAGDFNQNIKYIPIVMDTFGGLNEDGESAIKSIIERNVETKGRYSKGTLWRRLFHTLFTENVKMILKRLPG